AGSAGRRSSAPQVGAGQAEDHAVAAGALLDVACRVATERYRPPLEVTAAAREVAGQVASLPAARVRRAVETVILGPNLGEGLHWPHDGGVLGVFLPELDATVDSPQEAGRRHKDVWEHTKQVVLQAPPKPLVRWSALLHDIGKVPTRVMLPD